MIIFQSKCLTPGDYDPQDFPSDAFMNGDRYIDYSLVYPVFGIGAESFFVREGERGFEGADYECHEQIVYDDSHLYRRYYIVDTLYHGQLQDKVLSIAIRPGQCDGGPEYIADYLLPKEFGCRNRSFIFKDAMQTLTWKKFCDNAYVLYNSTCLLRCDAEHLAGGKTFWVGLKLKQPSRSLKKFYQRNAEHAKYLTIFDDWTYVLSEAEDDRVEKAATPKATSQVKAMNNISALLPLLLLKHDKANLADNKLLLLAMMSGGSGGDQSNLMQLLMMKELLGEKQNPNPPDGTT